MVAFSPIDVGRSFPTAHLRNGRAYLSGGRVRSLAISNDGATLFGEVQGSTGKPYRVKVAVLPTSRAPRPGHTPVFNGHCSCPAGANCKHVVAVLFAALERGPVPVQGRASSPTPPRPTPPRPTPPRPTPLPPAPPDEIGQWLATLDQAVDASDPEAYPADVRHRLIYCLSIQTFSKLGRCPAVEPVSVQLRKSGEFNRNTAKGLRLANFANNCGLAKYLRSSDLYIMRSLAAVHGPYYPTGAYALAGDMGNRLLEAIVATGRCRWQTLKGPVVTAGPPRRARPGWTSDTEGRQRFQFQLEDGTGNEVLLPFSPFRYLDPAGGACGPVETGLPAPVAAALAAAPVVSPQKAAALTDAIARRFPNQPALRPVPVRETVVRPVPPVPCLHLTLEPADPVIEDGPIDDGWPDDDEIDDLLPPDHAVARLSFAYDGTELPPNDPREAVNRLDDGTLISVPRQRAAEREAWETLKACGFAAADVERPGQVPAGDLWLDVETDDSGGVTMPPLTGLFRFLDREVPRLRAAGWRVTLDDSIPQVLAEPADDWSAEIDQESSGIDWFGLSLGVTVDGERVDLVPLLLPILRLLPDDGTLEPLAELAAGPASVLYVPLDAGRVLPMPLERVRPLLAALYDLYRVGGIAADGTIRFSQARLAELAELAAAAAATGLRWVGNTRLLELGRRLCDPAGIPPVPPPAGLRASLRPYQQHGLDWLQFLRDIEMGGVLADDMGLGKTVQALAHLLVEKEAGRLDRPCLVIAPTSLMANWRREAARFAPALSVLVLQGTGRKAGFGRIAGHDLVLTTYPLLPRDKDVLLAEDWHLVILDEAQAIKNPKAQAALIAVQLKARHRLCLTGTPLENNLDELWSLYQFLAPGLLGDHGQFKRVFRVPIEKRGDQDRQRLLARRVRPFLLRRTKGEVAADLPDKTEIIEPIELGGAQRDLYESLRVAMDARVRAEISAKGLARSHITILDALLKLRQVCCDPRLVKLRAAAAVKTSAKLARLLELVEALVPAGRRILLFSQFTGMLSLIEDELAARRITYVKLTGQTRDRETPVARFQAGEVPVFLISLKAGGTGLNLTAADTVILYDPWWNPAVERQAIDRAHRIGQDKAVFVHKMVTVGTVEEAILGLQARKQALADGLFDPEAGTGTGLTEEDLSLLFAPLSA